MARKNSNAGQPRKARKAREVPSKVVEDRKDIAHQDPTTPEAIKAKRESDARRKQEAVRAREQQLAEAADPGGDHPNVLVVKRTELAARAEQERIDAGKAAAKRQKPQEAPPKPPESGTLPQEFNPMHPVEPNPIGSSPHSPGTPAGPMGEDVIYVTDDIKADGTPNVSPGFVEPTPEFDGEGGRFYTDVLVSGANLLGRAVRPFVAADDDGNLEPVINSHSEEGARLDEIKLQRPVVYVPNDFTRDPTTGNPDRREAQEHRKAARR
jgi:hypothetical protein